MKKLSLSGLFLMLALALAGCKGPKGDTGASGGGRVIATIYCAGTVSGMAGGAAPLNGLDVEYNAVLTAGGDVYATANIVDEASQVSGTAFYAAAEPGSATAEVPVTADYVGVYNGGFWRVSLNRNTLVTSVEYDDPSLASVATMAFTASSCTVSHF